MKKFTRSLHIASFTGLIVVILLFFLIAPIAKHLLVLCYCLILTAPLLAGTAFVTGMAELFRILGKWESIALGTSTVIAFILLLMTAAFASLVSAGPIV